MVGKLGLIGRDSFEPLLLDLILGKRKYAPDVIGGSGEDVEPRDEQSFHFISFEQLATEEGSLLICLVRLFAFLGAPTYQIVVGRCGSDFFPPKRGFLQ